jgi:hypothetical protein
LGDLDALARAISTDETDKIYTTSANDLHEFCVRLYNRAVEEMAHQVKQKGLAVIDNFRKTWLSNVDKHETASQVLKKGGKEILKRQLKNASEYLDLWKRFLVSKKDHEVQLCLYY